MEKYFFPTVRQMGYQNITFYAVFKMLTFLSGKMVRKKILQKTMKSVMSFF
jgi:hypothetical protein